MSAVLPKTKIMQYVIQGVAHEIFSHSHMGEFDVTAMRAEAAAGRYGVYTVNLSDICDHIRAARVFEEERIATLPEESWRRDPGLMLIESWPVGEPPTCCSIDGHHRALRREREGLTNMAFYFVPIALAIRPKSGGVQFADWGAEVIGPDGKIVPRRLH